jgi:hypothetical protein
MTSSEWEDVMEDLLDGVEQELRSAAPIKIKGSLNIFRTRLKEVRTVRKCRHFEQELEAFLQSEPSLRGATERYLCKKTTPAIEAAVAATKRALALLEKAKRSRRV